MKLARATALMFNDSKILLIHRFKDGKEYYVLPGGKIEDGETPEIATVRELKEETSLVSKTKEKVFEFTDTDGHDHHIFTCEYVSGEVRLEPSSGEVLATTPHNTFVPMWVEIAKIPELTMWPGPTKPFLMEYFKDKLSLK